MLYIVLQLNVNAFHILQNSNAKNELKKSSNFFLLTNRSASSQTEPLMRAKMASSQSYRKRRNAELSASTSSSSSRPEVVCFCGVILNLLMLHKKPFCPAASSCTGSYFGVLVQQQSSFWVPSLFSQLLYKRKEKQVIGWTCNDTLIEKYNQLTGYLSVWLSTCISMVQSIYLLLWLPARSLASRANWSGGRGICCATQMAFLQLELLANACRALTGSPHRHSNRQSQPACCCSTRCWA